MYSQQTQNICVTLIQRRITLYNVIQMVCVHWVMLICCTRVVLLEHVLCNRPTDGVPSACHASDSDSDAFDHCCIYSKNVIFKHVINSKFSARRRAGLK